MVRTRIQLSEARYEELKRAAARRGVSMAHLVREGVSTVLSSPALVAAGSKAVSLTDWSSFEVIRRERIERAFAFDRDFQDRGFETLPSVV